VRKKPPDMMIVTLGRKGTDRLPVIADARIEGSTSLLIFYFLVDFFFLVYNSKAVGVIAPDQGFLRADAQVAK
jgi:hypothetical protein